VAGGPAFPFPPPTIPLALQTGSRRRDGAGERDA
jgi:hypothetical protein